MMLAVCYVVSSGSACFSFFSLYYDFRQTLSRRHTLQLGTLGGGNHFVELVYDEEDSSFFGALDM